MIKSYVETTETIKYMLFKKTQLLIDDVCKFFKLECDKVIESLNMHIEEAKFKALHLFYFEDVEELKPGWKLPKGTLGIDYDFKDQTEFFAKRVLQIYQEFYKFPQGLIGLLEFLIEIKPLVLQTLSWIDKGENSPESYQIVALSGTSNKPKPNYASSNWARVAPGGSYFFETKDTPSNTLYSFIGHQANGKLEMKNRHFIDKQINEPMNITLYSVKRSEGNITLAFETMPNRCSAPFIELITPKTKIRI